jgi:hypothetical protein
VRDRSAPFPAAKNVLRFRFNELTLRGNARELEAADVLLGEWRGAGRVPALTDDIVQFRRPRDA